MDIRPVAAGEWRAYREIRLAALRDTPEAFGSTWQVEVERTDAEWRSRTLGWTSGEDRRLFVAADPALGWVGLAGGVRPGEAPADADLVSMWVAPPARRLGVGARLVRAVIGWAAATGAGSLGLWVTRGNEAATGLYAKLGFRATGATQPLPSNPGRDELQMLLDLAG